MTKKSLTNALKHDARARWLKEIRDTPLIAKRKARLEIEKMILGTRPVEVNHRDPKKLRACLGGKA